MHIEFDKNIRFGWKEVLAVCFLIFTLGGIYISTKESINQATQKAQEVSTRQIDRAVLVDGKLEKINENIADLKKEIAVSQANQGIISGQIKQLQDYLMEGRAKVAVYRTGGSD